MAYNTEKNILHHWMSGKKLYLQRFGEKKFLPKPDHPFHPPTFLNSQWSPPKDKIEGLWTGYHCPGMYEFEYVV